MDHPCARDYDRMESLFFSCYLSCPALGCILAKVSKPGTDGRRVNMRQEIFINFLINSLLAAK